jgi:hypothetical protein
VGPRVLLLGDRPVVALPACRALSRAGYEVGVTGSRALDVVGVSRHASRYHRLPPIDGAAGDWSVALRALVDRLGYAVVVATSDAGVARLLRLDLPVPSSPEISDRQLPLIDKGQLATLCASASVDYPRTDRPRTPEHDEALSRGIAGETIVKAARSAVATPEGLTLLPGALKVHDYQTASRAMASIRRRGVDPVVQEYLDGEKLQAVIIRREGSTSFRMAFRVRREYPPERGGETMLERLGTRSGLGAELTGMLERLADAAHYNGVLQAEFYRTASGRLCVIDVNPRLWGSLAFAELLGLRMTERVVRDALGLDPVPVPEESTARRYHHLLREFRWLRARPREIASVLATSSPRDVWDTPSLKDPLPELVWLTRKFLTWAARKRPWTGGSGR